MGLLQTLRTSALACTAALLLLPHAPAEGAADETVPSAHFRGLLDAVGSPAAEEAVRVLLADPETWTDVAGEAAAGTLWHAGGYAAAQGLCRLVRHRDPAVVRASLDGLVAVNLRVSGVSTVRRLLGDKDPAVRTAAHDALARMGDASDLPRLLEELAGDDLPVRSLAHRALVLLTGQALKAEARRWVSWNEQDVPRLVERLAAAVQLLDEQLASPGEPASPEAVEAAWLVVERQGWLDVEGLVVKGIEWLNLWTPEGRAFGYRLATAHRLGELATAVARAARRDRTGPAAELAARACLQLGVVAEKA